MKTQIYYQTIGIILETLATEITGGFTTEKTNNSLIINFSHKHREQSIEIQNDKTDNMRIFFNNNAVSNCLEFDKTLLFLFLNSQNKKKTGAPALKICQNEKRIKI